MKDLRLDVSFDALATDPVHVPGAKDMPEMNASCAPAPVTPDSCDTLPQLEEPPV